MAARLAYAPHPVPTCQLRRHAVVCRSSSIKSHSSSASSSRDEQPQTAKKMSRREQRPPRPLIKVSTSGGRNHREWTSEYALTLRELRLSDLVSRNGEKDADVTVELSVQKHTGFGFSIDGRVYTCLNSVCSSCSCSYRREIDTTFNVWVLPSVRRREDELPEIGGDDPSLRLQKPSLRFASITLFLLSVSARADRLPEVSYQIRTFSSLQVIYVKPGAEADLDSVIRDAIWLTASTQESCSKACEQSTPIRQYVDDKKSFDRRWARLLEIKRSK